MATRLSLLLTVLLISTINLYAQPTTGDCLGAIPVCTGYYFQPNTSTGVGSIPGEIYSSGGCPYNCLDGEVNSTWYIFTVQEAGMLRFTISPIDPNDDYDWAVYNLTNHKCENIYSQANEMCVSCNSAGGVGLHGDTGADSGFDECAGPGSDNGNTKWNEDISVEEGETYVLYVSDWTQSPTGYSLDFSASSAVIFDDVPPELDSIFYDDVSGCMEDQLRFKFSEKVRCDRVTPSILSVEGPGGPYNVIDVYGEACDFGGEWEIEYTLTLDKPFQQNGTYQLLLATGFNGVVDACNNIAPADTADFTLDLGAPSIGQFNLVITNSTCGVANGSITGLSVSGNGTLYYYWTNQVGDTVGYSVDLLNVPSGSYTLEVTDDFGCISFSGPHQVLDEGAPIVDETGLGIISSTCSDPNGSITGILVSGSDPFTYQWTDQGGNPVGNDIDLIDAMAGTYTLTIEDVNTCQVVTGPYDITDTPGPTLVEDNMLILPSTCDSVNGSITGIFSSGSTPLNYVWIDGSSNVVGNNIDLLNVSSGNYTLTISDQNSCEIVGGPYNITSLPAAVVDDAGINIINSTCGAPDGSVSGLLISGSSPFTYEWRDGSGSLVGSDIDLINVSAGFYLLTIWDDNLCETTAGPYQVADEGGPDIEISAMNISPSNCFQSDASITGIQTTGMEPITYSWKNNSGTEVGTQLDLINVPEGLYTLEATDANTCVSYSGPHDVDNIGGAEITMVTPQNPQCEDTNGVININAAGGLGQIEYSIDGGQNWQMSGNFSQLSPGNYIIQIRDEHACITDYYMPIDLQNDGQAVHATASCNGPVCEGDLVQLECDISSAQYVWNGPAGFASNSQNPTIPAATVNMNGIYTVTVTTTFNCQGTSDVDLQVVAGFTMSLLVTPSANPIYRGDEVTFTASCNPAGFTDEYIWRIDGVEVQRGQDSTFTASNIMDEQVVTCEMTTNGGCIKNNPAISNNVVMDVEELPMHFPNSFKPSSTLLDNQVFKPKTKLENIEKYNMMIYNKWGQEIFKSDDVNTGWDGNFNGKLCPVGVYVYSVIYELEGNQSKEGERYELKGSFVLVQ